MKRKSIVKFILVVILFLLCCFYIYNFEKEEVTSKTLFRPIKDAYVRKNERVNKKEYIAYLKIPTLNINRGLYSYTDKRNDVGKEVMVLETSNFLTGNIVLAAHSGNSRYAYFNNLDKLDENMYIYILYKNYMYTYKLFKKEEIKKTGYVDLETYSYPTMKLITCKKDSKEKQIIFITKLIKKEKKEDT